MPGVQKEDLTVMNQKIDQFGEVLNSGLKEVTAAMADLAKQMALSQQLHNQAEARCLKLEGSNSELSKKYQLWHDEQIKMELRLAAAEKIQNTRKGRFDSYFDKVGIGLILAGILAILNGFPAGT